MTTQIKAGVIAANAVNSSELASGALSGQNFTGDVTFDTTTLFVDSTNNRVGIGITPNEGKLHVKSDGAGEVELLTLENSTGTNGKTTLTFKTTSTDATKSAQIFAERINASGHTDLAFRTYNGSTTEHMRIDSSGNVGIGTNNPTDTYNYGKVLDIHGSTGAVTYLRDADATSNFGFVAYDGGSTNRMVVGGGGTAYLRFVSGGSECGRFDTSGRLLIGQDSGDAFNDDSMLRIQRTGDRVFQQFKCDADQNIQILFGDVDDDVESSIQYYPADKNLIFATGNNEDAMTIDSSQNVGIGTASPAAELDVYGDGSGIAVGRPWGNDSYVSSGYFGKLANTAAGGGWNAGSAFMKIEDSLTTGVRKGTNIDFVTHNYGTGNQTTMTLSAEGNVGINNSSPDAQLHIRPVNDSGDAVVIIEADVNNDVESDNPMLYFKQDGAAVVGRICYTSNNVFEIINQYNSSLIIGRNNTTDISINTSGVVSGDFNDTSDINLKENISNIDGGLSVVNQLRAVNFDWKSDEKQNGKAGFIAQEVEEILPNEISENDSGKSINSTAILAHAIKAIQEQQTIIDDLKSRLDEAGL